MPKARLEKGRPHPTTRAHPGSPQPRHAAELKCAKPAKSYEHADDEELSESQLLTRTPALHKGDKDEECSVLSDTEGSNGDEDYDEDDSGDNSGTASDASGPAIRRSQLSEVTHRRASTGARRDLVKWLKAPSEITAPKRKTTSFQPENAKGQQPRKRVKFGAEKSDEDSDENPDEESDEVSESDSDEESEYEEVAHRNVNHPAKVPARGQNFSALPVLPPLSRKYQPWTTKEEETLFRLRKKGNSWKYIGEDVLGRTAKGAKNRWECLRTESLQPVRTRSKGVRRVQNPAVISAMAKMGKKNKPWSKDEESILIRLRAQGKTLKHISGRIRGRGLGACKTHWRKIKDQYQPAVAAPKYLEFDGKGDPSDRPDAYITSASRLDQEAKEAESNPFSAIVDYEDLESRTHHRSYSWPQ